MVDARIVLHKYEVYARVADPNLCYEPSYPTDKIGMERRAAAGIPMEGKLGSPVPSILWDAFEEALHTNMYRLAKDIATSLGQPHQPLLDAIKTNKIRPFLVEGDRNLEIACDYVCRRPDAPGLLQTCGQVVFWGTGLHRCPQHMYSTPLISSLPVVKAIQAEDVRMYVTEDGEVYDGMYNLRGRMFGKKIVLFELEE
jgi:hypothetical protein